MDNHIDPETELYIDRKAREEAERVFSLIGRLASGIGVLATVTVGVAATLGIPVLIRNTVNTQLEEQGYREIQQQARQGRDEILHNLEEARELIAANAMEMGEHLETAARSREEWESQPGLEVRVHMLNVPPEAGTTQYDTGVSIEDFAATAISGFSMYGMMVRDVFTLIMSKLRHVG